MKAADYKPVQDLEALTALTVILSTITPSIPSGVPCAALSSPFPPLPAN